MSEDNIGVREARRDDLETLARWAEAMALEPERKRLDAITVRRGTAAGTCADSCSRRWMAAP